MKQFLNVLKFELGNYFKSKSFMVTTILLALAVAAAVALPPVFMKGSFSEVFRRKQGKYGSHRRRGGQKAALLMAITIRMQMYWLLQIRTAL